MTAYYYLAAVILSWAAGPVVIRMLGDQGFGSVHILAGFNLFSFLTMGILALVRGELAAIRRLGAADFRRMAVNGFLGVFLYGFFYCSALIYAPPGEANIIHFTWPIWIVVLSVLILREPVNRGVWIALGLGFSGVLVVGTEGRLFSFNPDNLKGYGFALLAAFFWGLYSVLVKARSYPPCFSMMIYSFTGFACFALLLPSAGPMPALTLGRIGVFAIMGAYYLGIVSVLWFRALSLGNTARVGNLSYLTPFVSLFYFTFFLGIPMKPYQFAGLTLVLSGPLLQGIFSHVRSRRACP